MKRFIPTAALLLAGLLPKLAAAQLPAPYGARLQYVLDSTCDRFHIRGASAAVYVPGSGIWTGTHGEAWAGQPLTASMALPLNSNTKVYTGTLLLKLQEAGLVHFSDTIGTWFHNTPNINGKITIQQLITHTSGLYNFTDAPDFLDSIGANCARVWQSPEIVQRFVKAPLAAPGGAFSYSNTNYLLAGMIIEQVTGMPLAQAFRTKLLGPAGLSDTWFYPQEMPPSIPHFWFYRFNQVDDGNLGGYTPEAFYSAAGGAGALFATAADNTKFWSQVSTGQLLNAASTGTWRMDVTGRATMNGHLVYAHGGRGIGAVNESLTDSVSGVCISVLTNQDSANNDIVFYRVVAALHRVTFNPPTAAVAVVPPPASFAMYPNPAADVLHVSWKGPAGTYAILDATGALVRTGTLQTSETAVPLHGLAAGTYYLRAGAAAQTPAVQAFQIVR